MKTRKLFGVAFLIAASGVCALVACSSDTPSTAASSSAGETVTVHVSAAAGGTVSDKSGKVTLAIPAGALAKDTDISLAIGAAANGSAGDVYDFGPDGLQFLKPVTLTVKGDGITVPEGKTAAIGLLAGSTFTKVEGSTFANGVATAPVMHFTKYAVIIVDGNVILQPPSQCTDVISKFTNCGGDPTGTWAFTDFCVEQKILDTLKQPGCDGAVGTIEVSSTQTVTFSGGATSGTVTSSNGTITTVIVGEIPKTCLSDAGTVACADMSKPTNTPPNVCTESTTAGNCHCEQTETKQQVGSTNPFPDSDPAKRSEYCVTGNTLVAREFKNSAPTGTFFVLTKQ